MSRVATQSYTESYSALLETHSDQAVQCCVNKWNQFCSQYPITDTVNVTKRKRWIPFGQDVTVIKEIGDHKDISKIMFSVNNKLTAKAFRKHNDSTLIVVSCRIWWNYNGYLVRGWLDHIVVDVMKECIVQFPRITPLSPYWETPI